MNDIIAKEFTHPETVAVDDGEGGFIIKNKSDVAEDDKVLSESEVEKRRKAAEKKAEK